MICNDWQLTGADKPGCFWEREVQIVKMTGVVWAEPSVQYAGSCPVQSSSGSFLVLVVWLPVERGKACTNYPIFLLSSTHNPLPPGRLYTTMWYIQPDRYNQRCGNIHEYFTWTPGMYTHFSSIICHGKAKSYNITPFFPSKTLFILKIFF